MRTFIAVEVSDTVKPKILALQKKIKSSGADIRLVEPENLHYNLKFLGEIDETDIEKVKTALSGISYPAFDVHITGIGAFPSATYIRVIWLGAKEGGQELTALAKAIEEALTAIGIGREERPFVPHLTLCRVENPKAKESLVKIVKNQQATDVGKIRIDKIILFQSKLSPKGPTYTPLHTVKLV